MFVLQPLTRGLEELQAARDEKSSEKPEHTLECRRLLERWARGCWMLVRLLGLVIVLEMWSLVVEAGYRDPAGYIAVWWWWGLASVVAVYMVVMPSVKFEKVT